jgi:hypothetical protein
VGLEQNGPGKGEGKEKENVLTFFKKNYQTNEFKHKFELKHLKAMHQHVCNIKLLQLICIILENVKCLKEIKENLVLKIRVKVANKF